ncbi:diguanylate cyclase [Alteromonas sp. MMG017]|uniref:ligand-binding sensor domain-containing diguanylate cyclase n=1 Tax=Alteromonas sp. MMG017 TaxID=2822692 RepID=UPI001B3A2804|nr:ligand-binding sensor domain-containing diguanylate cyclase [Alteromonas sp. MMG017]MBQ4829789.1 diguanylate cyclase [Alteromonas sp. MMG017]
MFSVVVRFLVTATILLPIVFSLAATSRAADFPLPVFKSFSIEEGLSQVSVLDIAEDKNGYIWLATQAGIDRFDGNEFKHFGKWQEVESDGLYTVTTFQIESSLDKEYLWIGTIAGVSRFHIETATFEHFPISVSSHIKAGLIKRIKIDKSGNVWVISGRALYRFSTLLNKLVQVAVLDNVTSTLTDIVIDGNSHVWLSSTSGLYKLNSAFNTLELQQLAGTNLTLMALAADESLWIGTGSDGLCRYPLFASNDFSVSTCFDESNGLSSNDVLSVLFQRNDNIWIATSGGVNIIRAKEASEIVSLSVAQSKLANNYITSLYQTEAGAIVAGSRDNGFSIHNPVLSNFSTSAVIGNNISGIATHSDNALWLATEQNLWHYNYQSGKVSGPYTSMIESEGKLSSNKLLTVHYDKQSDSVWLSTRAGLAKLNTASEQLDLVALKGKAGYTLNVDADGDVWYGGYSDGVFVYRPSENRVIRQWPISLTTRIVFEDNESAWLASISGLYFANKFTGEIRNVGENNANFPKDAVVTWVSRSIRGGYWIGTQANGIYFMAVEDNEIFSVSFTQIEADSYLSNISIGAIIEDQENELWISTTVGIAHIDSTLSSVSYFGAQNGVSEAGYYIGAAVKAAGDTIFMGSPQGLTRFKPTDIKQQPWSPKVNISHIEIINEHSSGSENLYPNTNIEELVLSSNNVSFSVEFAALDFTRANEVSYAYLLSGFDNKWRFTDHRRRAVTYTNLAPGNYTLTIRAMNKEKVWTPNEATLQISIVPPWWDKPVWRSAIFVSAFLLLTLLVWWRIQTLKNRSVALAKMVEEKTKDLEDVVEKLTQLSSQDSLTGLKNRRYFTSRAHEAWDSYERYAQAFSLLIVDIDWFKRINDTYGHHVGDLILVKISELLRTNLRNSDVICRWGGEEFLILLPELNVHECYWVGEKLRKAVEKTSFHCEGHDVHVTITAGIADIRESDSVEQCIHAADKKLYKGKAEGRNAVVK